MAAASEDLRRLTRASMMLMARVHPASAFHQSRVIQDNARQVTDDAMPFINSPNEVSNVGDDAYNVRSCRLTH